jgi:hypothetical protein
MNFSIHYKFNPITINKAIKIINYKLEKINNNNNNNNNNSLETK